MIVKLTDGRILEAPPRDAETAALVFEIRGSLDATGYAHALPALTSVGGSLYATGYAHALPALTSIGGSLYATGYAHDLPSLTSIGGSLYAARYAHALPSLTSVGGVKIDDAPFIGGVHNKIYDAAKADYKFDMSEWGKDTDCGTGRCRGGHVVNAAGPAGFDLKSKVGWAAAAMLIYLKSDPLLHEKGYPNFSDMVKNSDALADMKRCAELEVAA